MLCRFYYYKAANEVMFLRTWDKYCPDRLRPIQLELSLQDKPGIGLEPAEPQTFLPSTAAIHADIKKDYQGEWLCKPPTSCTTAGRPNRSLMYPAYNTKTTARRSWHPFNAPGPSQLNSTMILTAAPLRTSVSQSWGNWFMTPGKEQPYSLQHTTCSWLATAPHGVQAKMLKSLLPLFDLLRLCGLTSRNSEAPKQENIQEPNGSYG